MIVLGVILLLLGWLLTFPYEGLVVTIGIILIVVGVVMFILGRTGRRIGGRSHYY